MPASLFNAYCAAEAGAFYPGHFGDPACQRRALGVARPIAPALADALQAQNAKLPPSPQREAHLTALRRGAAAVVTGQQMGLFLGPLFTLYKVATTVRLAQSWAHEAGQPVVPVFWLQNEDHDLAEIAVNHAPSRQGNILSLSVPAAPTSRLSVADCQLPEHITATLLQLHDAVSNLPHAAAHMTRLQEAYQVGVGWTQAFAQVLAGLFADSGLVLLDPRDPAIARLAAPVHARALDAAPLCSQVLLDRGQTLAAAGFTAAVHVRPEAPLSFFHPDGAHGPRYRLAPTDDGYALVGTDRTLNRAALQAALRADPMTFSSSALLRPIVQDTLLPTAAYVGGPGEIAYFAQLAPLYELFETRMPLVVPRLRARLIESKTQRLLTGLHARPADAALPADTLLARDTASSQAPKAPATLAPTVLAAFDAALQPYADSMLAASPGLQSAIDKTRSTVDMAVGKLADKWDKAQLHQNQARVEDVQRLKMALCPQGIEQERFYGMAYYACRYGEQAFVERIVHAATPWSAQVQDITLEG